MRNLLLVAAALALPAAAQAKTYEIDPVHSTVMFKIKHLVSKVTGRFDRFEGTIDYEKGDPAAWGARASIESASINTNNGKRDEHLRAEGFFDAERCPKLAFKSLKVTDAEGSKAKLHGELTMRCVTKPVVLDVEILGESTDPQGNAMLGASARATINRQDFGVSWNKTLDAGGFILGDEVEIVIDIEAGPKAKKKPAR